MSIKYSDSGFLDGADETKKLSFDVSGVTTGTTRTITMPDANVDLSSVGTPDDNSVTLAKMAGGTDGNLITYDASGDPAYVTTGTSGQVLTSGGAGVAPTFQAAAAGGKVLQVISKATTASTITSSSSYVTWDTIVITPTLASSELFVTFNVGIGVGSLGGLYNVGVQITGNSTEYWAANGLSADVDGVTYETGAFGHTWGCVFSPSTTSAVTIALKVKLNSGPNNVRVNSSVDKATIIVMEIGA